MVIKRRCLFPFRWGELFLPTQVVKYEWVCRKPTVYLKLIKPYIWKVELSCVSDTLYEYALPVFLLFSSIQGKKNQTCCLSRSEKLSGFVWEQTESRHSLTKTALLFPVPAGARPGLKLGIFLLVWSRNMWLPKCITIIASFNPVTPYFAFAFALHTV